MDHQKTSENERDSKIETRDEAGGFEVEMQVEENCQNNLREEE